MNCLLLWYDNYSSILHIVSLIFFVDFNSNDILFYDFTK